MALYDADSHANAAFDAMLQISEYDQYIGGVDDEASWLKDQHPRHDDLPSRLLTAAHGRGEARHARALIDGAQWAKTPSVQDPLAAYTTFHDAAMRRGAVEAIAWRSREGDGSPDPLAGAVSHEDPTTAFLAAEGLALVKRSEGVSVLLSAIELSEDFNHRGRAIKALGVLADPRGIDVLIGLAADDEHALQESAAEAIGHLAHTDQAETVFTLLDRLARGDGEVSLNALTGLRYFDTRDAWQRVRDRAADDDWHVATAAVISLPRLNGPDDLAVDFALIESEAGGQR
ncbi:MAG: ParB family chromosome partitioning protein [Bradymonadia bacterium]|jgi:ParB family chromosome partitioning protein